MFREDRRKSVGKFKLYHRPVGHSNNSDRIPLTCHDLPPFRLDKHNAQVGR